MGTIGFNAGNIVLTAENAKNHCELLMTACNNIKDQLDILLNDSNWSGTIKNGTVTDFENARNSIDSLNKTIKDAFQTLENIGTGFKDIKY